MLTVVVHEKGGKTQRVAFESDQIQVGREEDNEILLDRANVSKHHLRFRRVDGKVEVVDLESTNGTYVNGRRVTGTRVIRRSDRIYVGDYILTLEGDDPAIAPREHAELALGTGADGAKQRVPVAVPPITKDRGESLPGMEDVAGDDLMTSARRVAAPGTESTYLDKIASRILQTVMINVRAVDPFVSADIGDSDKSECIALIDSLIDDMRSAGEIDENVAVTELKAQVTRELLELGPLTELMKDDEVGEIQVVGGGRIKVVRDRGPLSRSSTENQRFSGDRALTLCIQRMARRRGFLVEGSQVLEGKVGDGFYMYALLPPTPVRSPLLSLRRVRTDANSLAALVQEGVMSEGMRELLRAAVIGSRRILVCASGGVNLDRFMGALVGEIPDELRVACISDSGRLGASRSGWVRVRRIADPSDTVSLSDALGVILRGGIDLLVSQRCRHEDAAAVIDAISGASRGALVSMWGIDSAHALSRLAALSTVASGAIHALTVALARSVDLLVRLNVGVGGESMQVIEVVEPRVSEGDKIEHVSLFVARRNSDGGTDFLPSGTQPGFLPELRAQGINVSATNFKR